jgi:hypothetical protein
MANKSNTNVQEYFSQQILSFLKYSLMLEFICSRSVFFFNAACFAGFLIAFGKLPIQFFVHNKTFFMHFYIHNMSLANFY